LISKNKKVNSYLLIPFLIILSFYNGVEHLFWLFYYKTYAPGVIFGFFVGVPFTVLIIYKMLKEKLVKKWYVSIFVILSIFLVIQAVNLGVRLDPGIANSMLFSKKLAYLVWF
jgi:hypothetical protein